MDSNRVVDGVEIEYINMGKMPVDFRKFSGGKILKYLPGFLNKSMYMLSYIKSSNIYFKV